MICARRCRKTGLSVAALGAGRGGEQPMAATLRPTLAAGNVVLLGRIRSFNLRARGKDLLRRSVEVGLHDDDGLLTTQPCQRVPANVRNPPN